MPKHWSDQQLDLLQTQWGDSDVSLRDIAAAINAQTGARFSRNAIAGQAKRLGLPLRRRANGTRGPRPASARPATRIVAANLQRRKARPVIALPEEIAHANEPAHLGLSLFELTPQTCRYPRGAERFTFCGQTAQPGQPYCGFHMRLCYAPRDRSQTVAERRAA